MGQRRLAGLGAIAIGAVLAMAVGLAAQAQESPLVMGVIPTEGLGLVAWEGTIDDLAIEAAGDGCRLESVWATVGGQFIGYTVGAPDFVNANFESRIGTTLRASRTVLLVCAEGSASRRLRRRPLRHRRPRSRRAPHRLRHRRGRRVRRPRRRSPRLRSTTRLGRTSRAVTSRRRRTRRSCSRQRADPGWTGTASTPTGMGLRARSCRRRPRRDVIRFDRDSIENCNASMAPGRYALPRQLGAGILKRPPDDD